MELYPDLYLIITISIITNSATLVLQLFQHEGLCYS